VHPQGKLSRRPILFDGAYRPILSRDATVAQTAAEQLRAIQEVADSIAAQVHQAHARYKALCREIEALGLAEAVWKWRERREKWWQNILQVEVPKVAYWGLNRLPRAQAFAREVLAFVDQDERALAERRAELVLNEYLAREFDKGWTVPRRWKLHAMIGKSTKNWRGRNKYDVREVGLDPSGKIISTKARDVKEGYTLFFRVRTPVNSTHEIHDIIDADIDYFAGARAACKYCWSQQHENPCNAPSEKNPCNAGELELFP